jgi:hypothetical protein
VNNGTGSTGSTHQRTGNIQFHSRSQGVRIIYMVSAIDSYHCKLNKKFWEELIAYLPFTVI